MNAQIMLEKAIYTIRNADHLQVNGRLVEVQRQTPTGFETVAIVGEDLLVTIEPPERHEIEADKVKQARAFNSNGVLWYPVGQPLD